MDGLPTMELLGSSPEASGFVSMGSNSELENNCTYALLHKHCTYDHSSQEFELDNQHKSWVAGPTMVLLGFPPEASGFVSIGSNSELENNCKYTFLHKHWTYDHSSQKSEFDNQHRSCVASPTIELWVFSSEASRHISTGSGYRLQDTCQVAHDHKNKNSDHNSHKSEFDNWHKSWVAGPTIELWVFSSEAS